MAGPTTGKLHRHPVWLDIMVLDKINKDCDIHVACLDHLGENETLLGISKGRLHGGSELSGVVKEEAKKGRGMAMAVGKSFARRKSDRSLEEGLKIQVAVAKRIYGEDLTWGGAGAVCWCRCWCWAWCWAWRCKMCCCCCCARPASEVYNLR